MEKLFFLPRRFQKIPIKKIPNSTLRQRKEETINKQLTVNSKQKKKKFSKQTWKNFSFFQENFREFQWKKFQIWQRKEETVNK